jgi:O-antigen ligase
MDLVTLLAIGAALGYGVFRGGGVAQADWNVVLLTIGLAGCVHFLWRFREKVPRLDPVAGFAAGAFLFLVALQLAPLPISFVRLVSPHRVELIDAAVPLTGSLPRFAALSTVPHETLGYLLTISAYILVFLLIRDVTLRMGRWPWAATWPLLIVIGLEAVLGLYQSGAGSASDAVVGTYANRDHYAGLLEMALPLAAVYALSILQSDREEFESRAVPALKASFLFALAGILLVAIILSLSRMGFLAALAGLLVAGSAVLSVRGWRVEYAAKIPWWRRWVPLAAVILVITSGFIFLPTASLVTRFADLAKTDEVAADARAQIWRDTSALVRDYPWFGCGMGTYASCFLRYKTVAPMYTVDYAHNDYLQVLAETGVFGFCAGLLFILRLLQRTIRGCLYAHSVNERDLAIACLASMTAMLLHSLVDFNMYVPANGMVFAWIAGIAGVHLRRRVRRQAQREEKSAPLEV